MAALLLPSACHKFTTEKDAPTPVNPDPVVVDGAVDLGLPSGLKWAVCNLGASSPEEYGDYYAWGEVIPYYNEGHSLDGPCSSWRYRSDHPITGYNWSSYIWGDGSKNGLKKYCTISSYGTVVDNNTELDRGDDPDDTTIDDVARAVLGGSWRMPTQDDFQELKDNCTSDWIFFNDKYGLKFTSKKSGYTSQWIFLPAAGYRSGADLCSYGGSNGYYWSSSLSKESPDRAQELSFSKAKVDTRIDSDRFLGQSVRPVFKE